MSDDYDDKKIEIYNTILKIYKLPVIKEYENNEQTTILPTLRRVKLIVRADGTYINIKDEKKFTNRISTGIGGRVGGGGQGTVIVIL
jgi:hypothetical protein